MKARKIVGITGLFLALGAAGFFMLPPDPAAHILLSDATAAPLSSSPKSVGVFLKIENSGTPDRLISATSSDAQTASLTEGIETASIPAHGAASLAADGVFLRLENVAGPLIDGRTLPISLTFENAGTVQSRARIVAPRTEGAATKFGLFGIGDVCRVGDAEPAPEIELSAEKLLDGWQISVLSEDFEFTPDLVDGPHVPGTGHGHIYLNGLKLGRLYAPTKTIGALPSGEHEIRVTLSTNDHRAYVVGTDPVTASIRIISD